MDVRARGMHPECRLLRKQLRVPLAAKGMATKEMYLGEGLRIEGLALALLGLKCLQNIQEDMKASV